MKNRRIEIVKDSEDLATVAAEHVLLIAKSAIEKRGSFTLALSGGSTPKRLYELLASADRPFKEQIPWYSTSLYWGDERHVPPSHPDSNYRMVDEAMLSKIPIPKENIYRIKAEDPDAERAAKEYEETLYSTIDLKREGIPIFDLILLGMGEDGHTASLFPNTSILNEREKLVSSVWVEKLLATRISLTPIVINNASNIIFMVSGRGKAEVLKKVLDGESQPMLLPSQLINPKHGKLMWIVDRATAL
jgi:6-phosphogluconolactonase